MGDQLEKFVMEQRESFDVEPAMDPDRRWARIKSGMRPNRRKGRTLIWKVAAVLFLISTITLTVDRYYDRTAEAQTDPRFEEFLQAEAFYTSLINEKRKAINSYQVAGLSDEFKEEIDRLDLLYAELKQTFETRVNDGKLIDAMIRNLQLRIEILNQQIKILESLNHYENELSKNV